MNFGQALELLKKGKKVARQGWNGKGMFLYYVPANSYPASTEIAKEEFGATVEYGAYIAMKTAQGNVVPWLASQTDVLANDWVFEREIQYVEISSRGIHCEKEWVDNLSIGDLFNGYQPQTGIERLCLSLMEKLKKTEHPYHSILITEDSFKVLETKKCGMGTNLGWI